METTPTLSRAALRLLEAVAVIQGDGHLSADVSKVRRRVTHLNGSEFCVTLAQMIQENYIQEQSWMAGWRVWLTQAGWNALNDAGL